jgi:hypothetical protein
VQSRAEPESRGCAAPFEPAARTDDCPERALEFGEDLLDGGGGDPVFAKRLQRGLSRIEQRAGRSDDAVNGKAPAGPHVERGGAGMNRESSSNGGELKTAIEWHGRWRGSNGQVPLQWFLRGGVHLCIKQRPAQRAIAPALERRRLEPLEAAVPVLEDKARGIVAEALWQRHAEGYWFSVSCVP